MQRFMVSQARTRGFTLIELLVVVLIIGLVTVVALPTIVPAFNHRQVSEAGRILQGELVGARDRAIHANRPCGIRLLPDPQFPISPQPVLINGQVNPTAGQLWPYQTLAYNRIIPLESAPEYSEGFCTPVTPGTVAYFGSVGVQLGIPTAVSTIYPNALLLIESPFYLTGANQGLPHPPTSWFWNVRIGDKIQLNQAGPWYTIVGPPGLQASPAAGATNSEQFVNVGNPAPLGTYQNVLPTLTVGGQTQPVEYLLLVNGRDDNQNGWIDEGNDGVDQNGNGLVDEPAEVVFNGGEVEAWSGSVTTHATADIPYTIRRRPAPAPGAKEVSLPTSMLIDATTTFMTKERSRLPVNLFTGYVDIILSPDGTVLPTVNFSSPSSIGMDGAFLHFWLSERQDIIDVTLDSNGAPVPLQTIQSPPSVRYLPIAQPGSVGQSLVGPYLKGEYSVLSLNMRTGNLAVNENPPFLYDPTIGYQGQTGTWSPWNPFIQAEQGLAGSGK